MIMAAYTKSGAMSRTKLNPKSLFSGETVSDCYRVNLGFQLPFNVERTLLDA